MDSAEKYQRQLLEQAKAIYYETPLSEATQQAYLETPRHKFVRRYRRWGVKEWSEVNEGNLAEHLATLYADGALVLFGDEDSDVPSTISQPPLSCGCSTCYSLSQVRECLSWGQAAAGMPP